MMPSTKRAPTLVTAEDQSERRYRPTLSLNERRAYAAARRIMAIVEYGEHELACPGAIKTRRIDRVAAAIMNEFGK